MQKRKRQSEVAKSDKGWYLIPYAKSGISIEHGVALSQIRLKSAYVTKLDPAERTKGSMEDGWVRSENDSGIK